MSQSHSQILLHIIFSTKDRMPGLSPDVESELYAYMGGILNRLKSPPIIINGVKDHVHIFCSASKNMAAASIVEKVKSNSSRWIKTKGGLFTKFQWQSGYGTFSVSPSKSKQVERYIAGQKEHHKIVTYKEEYLRFLREYGIPYDERYLWN